MQVPALIQLHQQMLFLSVSRPLQNLMEVRIFDDRVVCSADNIEILRQRLPLPPGGRFGMRKGGGRSRHR